MGGRGATDDVQRLNMGRHTTFPTKPQTVSVSSSPAFGIVGKPAPWAAEMRRLYREKTCVVSLPTMVSVAEIPPPPCLYRVREKPNTDVSGFHDRLGMGIDSGRENEGS